jgi:hypothetical protein
MKRSGQSLWRLFSGLGMVAAQGTLLWGGLLTTEGCGFGQYDDSSAPQVVDSSTGVWDAGQWWPWACALPDGTLTNPAPQSTPINYTAAGTCGDGGAFALSVDGCEMFGNWDALGLSDVSTTIPTSIPQAGGWEVVGTGGFDVGDGGTGWTCDATATDSSGDLTLTCTAGTPSATACESTLTLVSGS